MDWRGRAGGPRTVLQTFSHATEWAGTVREEAQMSLCSCEDRIACNTDPTPVMLHPTSWSCCSSCVCTAKYKANLPLRFQWKPVRVIFHPKTKEKPKNYILHKENIAYVVTVFSSELKHIFLQFIINVMPKTSHSPYCNRKRLHYLNWKVFFALPLVYLICDF